MPDTTQTERHAPPNYRERVFFIRQMGGEAGALITLLLVVSTGLLLWRKLMTTVKLQGPMPSDTQHTDKVIHGSLFPAALLLRTKD